MNYRSGCPISNLVDLVGDKWSLLVIRDLFSNKSTFKQFANSSEKIATNILSDRLKSLREKGIIDFAFAYDNKKTKYYFLTDVGIDLYPIIFEMSMWSKKNLNLEFNDIATEWFSNNKNLKGEHTINNTINDYKLVRKELFDFIKAGRFREHSK